VLWLVFTVQILQLIWLGLRNLQPACYLFRFDIQEEERCVL